MSDKGKVQGSRLKVQGSRFLNPKEETMKKFIIFVSILISILLINNVIASEDIIGRWEGKLVPAPDSELTIHFIIDKNDDGSYSVVLDSPDQGAIKGIEATSVVFDSGKLTLDVTDLSGSYEGVLKDGKFEGNWMQEGTGIPLNLKPYEKPVLTEEDKAILTGPWHGPLDIPNVSLTAIIRFETNEQDKFVGFFSIPEQGGNETPLTDIELNDDGDFRFKLAGTLEYKGKLANDEIVGTLLQPGQPIPITLKKGEFKAPTYSLNLPKEIQDNLTGEWHGHLKMPTMNLHLEFRFETTEKGEFVGSYGVPDQNLKGIPFKEASITDGQLVLKIAVVNAEYKGELKGDELTGEWSQGGMPTMPLSMKKGEYVPPVYALDLPEETKEALAGEWHGHLKTAQTLLHVVLRFETTEKGEFLGFYDVPDQNVKGTQIFEASLSDGKLTLKIPNAQFKGELAGDELTGEVKQQQNITPLTLKKGEYVPPVYALDLPEETMETLSGEWYGKPDKITVVLRFEKNDKGDFLGFADSPDIGAPTVPITDMESTDNKLTVQIPHSGAEFKGEFVDNEWVGEWTQNAKTFQVTLKKGKYIPPVYSLDLPEEAMKLLTGKWQGKVGSVTIVMRFEKTAKGDFLGSFEIPEQKLEKIPIIEAKFSNGNLSIIDITRDSEIIGELSGDVFDAELIQAQAGSKIPITFKKE